MVVSALISDNKGRYIRLFIDGEFFALIQKQTTYTHALDVNQEVTAQELAHIIHHESSFWFNRVLKLLARRSYSQKEIEDYLNRKEVGVLICESVISKLSEKKLIDDRAFAENYIHDRLRFHPKGKFVLMQELKQKGIQTDLIEELLQKYVGKSQEQEMLRKLIFKKSKTLKGVNEIKKRQKLSQFLAQRGFAWNDIEQGLRSLGDIDGLTETE